MGKGKDSKAESVSAPAPAIARGPGQPTKYRPEYCQMLLDHMAKGLSFETFAGVVDVDRDTVYQWTYSHPEFSDAKRKGAMKSQLVWEEVGLTLAKTGTMSVEDPKGKKRVIVKGSTGAWIFNMKNRFGWKNEREDAAPPPPPSPNGAAASGPSHVTFEQFCERAGYPAPFPKQLEMREFGIEQDVPRLLLGSRGYGKTDYVVVLGVAYELYLDSFEGRQPSSTTLLVTKSKDRNAAILDEIYKAATANGVHFDKRNSASLRVKGLLGKDHSVSALTMGSSSVRGRHPKRIIMDDPVTPEDTSPATRKRVTKLYNELNKLCPNILILGQPVHKLDLYQTLRPLLMKMEVPYGSITELDIDLEAQRLAGVSEESIQASYFLKVMSENPSPFENVKLIDEFVAQRGTAVAFLDPSFEGGDLSALTIGAAYFDGIAIKGRAWKRAWQHCAQEIMDELVRCGVKRFCIETNNLGDTPVDLFRSLAPDGMGVVGRKSVTSKHARIMNAGAFADYLHLAKNSDGPYLDAVRGYEYGAEPDDPPDSLASLLIWLGLVRDERSK